MGKILKQYHNFLQFLPVRLLLVNLRRNRFLFLLWIFVFLIITGNFGTKYGIPTLFFSPEYLHKVNFLSYFLLGISFGIFFIAFHISGYVTNAYLFPFLATVKNPFYKFSLNNFVIPLTFIISYFIESINFQINIQLYSFPEILLNCLGLFVGIILLYFASFSWFQARNIDLNILEEKINNKTKKGSKTIEKIRNLDEEWKKTHAPDAANRFWSVKTYLKNPGKLKRTQLFEHYDPKKIQKVLAHNYKDALIYSGVLILIIFILGLYKEIPVFNLPAAVSIMLLISFIIIAFAALYTFFKEWSAYVFIGFFILFAYINQNVFLDYHRSAYGINYKINKNKINTPSVIDYQKIQKKDYQKVLKTLQKRRQHLINTKQKVSFIFVNTAGGGLKAGVWTYVISAYLDILTNGRFFEHTQLITGASGGMFGAAYARELYYEKTLNKIKTWHNDTILNNLSKDMLNPVLFSYVSSDIFYISRKFKYNNNFYFKDRAYMLEKSFNEHTNYVLDKPMSAYKKPEENALIPMMIFSPAEIENGRKVLISSSGISFLSNTFKTIQNNNKKVNIDFNTKYKDYNAGNLRFTTAVRMSASFPFVSPYVSLPGKDHLKLSDAGMTDNYGLSTSFQFLSVFSDWFIKNTDKIIFINISCDGKNKQTSDFNFLSDLTEPFQGALNNYFNFQRINAEELYFQTQKKLRKKIVFINLQINSNERHISVSWHLTNREKKIISKAINSSLNQTEIKKFLNAF
ncbi:MAG: patatin-like phospholipase family protein [Chlorobi bacterium]|nr:patatin-like phospholipase family protein [Chlorobiota bacterium]